MVNSPGYAVWALSRGKLNMTRRAFVTGSTGFLGLNIVEQLAKAGWEVFALRRTTSNTAVLDTMKAVQVIGDVSDENSLLAAMPENVDAVFHTAGDTSLWRGFNSRQYRINVSGTRNVVEAAVQKNAKRFIHTSSIGAYGKIEGAPLSEETPPRALESGIHYYETKYLAEQEVHKGIEQGLDAVIINPAQIIGPYDYNYTPEIFSLLKNGTMKGVPRGISVCGHVRDYAAAHLAAWERGKKGENYILGGVHASFYDIVDIVCTILDVKAPKISLPVAPLSVAAHFFNLVSRFTNREPILTPEKFVLMNMVMSIDSGKAEKELGFSTCSLKEMFTDSYQWMVSEGIA